MTWTHHYKAYTEVNSNLSPVYLVLCADVDGVALTSSVPSTTQTEILIDGMWDMSPVVNEPIFVYDTGGWEFMRLGKFVEEYSTNTDRLEDLTRGYFGTVAKTFASDSRVIRPRFMFSTETISELGEWCRDLMTLPEGHTTTIDYREGRTDIGKTSFGLHDQNEIVTRALNSLTPIGKRIVILGGYRGFLLKDYVILYSGVVSDLSYRLGVYRISTEAGFSELLNTERFTQIEDAKTALDGSINNSQTTITVDNGSNLYLTDNSRTGTAQGMASDDGHAAFYYYLKEGANVEKMRVDTSVGPAFKSVTVVRGQLGTSGQAFSDDVEATYFWYVRDHPISIVLYFLLTGKPAFATGDYNLNMGDDDDEQLGLNFSISDVNVAEFERIRDTWFPGQVEEHYFHEKTRIRNYIEQHLLKPRNLCLYLDRSGKISLAMIAPPLLTEEIFSLTEDDIIDVPEISFNSSDVLNVITTRWEYDSFEDEYANSTRYVDGDSVTRLGGKEGAMTIEAKGVTSSYSGSTVAQDMAEDKTIHGITPPTIDGLGIPFNKGAAIEPGRIVLLTHSKLPDIETGTIGFSRAMRCTGKRINWQSGTIEVDLISTIYSIDGRYAVIGPSTLPDYTAATDEQKEKYIFIADATDNEMSNGDAAYLLY